MDNCTVNIADFRCRSIKFRTKAFHPAHKQTGPVLVESRCGCDVVSFSSATQPGRPRVFDIGVAQRSRSRLIFRPIPIQRRANVIRFHEVPASVPGQQVPRWTPPMNGPSDLPPAA